MNSIVIYDFNKKSNLQGWTIVDDVVMGGDSSGSFTLNDDGHGVFEGRISLNNNGGFSSVKYRFQKLAIEEFSKVIVKLRGELSI